MLNSFMDRRRVTEERPPDSSASEKIRECRNCHAIHDSIRTECCASPDVHGKMVLSQYGDVTFRQWCDKEAERLTKKGLSPMVHVEGNMAALYCKTLQAQ